MDDDVITEFKPCWPMLIPDYTPVFRVPAAPVVTVFTTVVVRWNIFVTPVKPVVNY